MTERFVLSKLIFRSASPSRWSDIETLFGERGACGGCWCMYWMIPGKAWSEAKGTKNRKALRRIVRAGKRPGVLAYYGGEAIGWCAVAPRADYPRLARSRVLKPVDDRAVWSITCLFIQRSYRRKGVSSRLIRAATEFAGKRGARIIEGYPIVSTMAKTPDPFIWTGVPSAFKRAGFKEVARRSKTRPIMRITKRRSSR